MEHDTDYELIYEMRPGLTSEATLYNGYTDTMEKMLRRLHMDIDYLKRRSLWLGHDHNLQDGSEHYQR